MLATNEQSLEGVRYWIRQKAIKSPWPRVLCWYILPQMDVVKMIAQLRAETVQINEAILALERIARNGTGRRSGPPAELKAAAEPTEPTEELPNPGAAKQRKKYVFSAEARQRMAEAQKKRWAVARAAHGLGWLSTGAE